MECFATADIVATVAELQRCLSITDLPRWYASVDKPLSDVGDRGEIYCVWGGFLVHREEIRDGLRFTLPDCPNALQWTVTTGQPPNPDQVIVRLTIDRTGHDSDFVDSNRQFVADWKAGLENNW